MTTDSTPLRRLYRIHALQAWIHNTVSFHASATMMLIKTMCNNNYAILSGQMTWNPRTVYRPPSCLGTIWLLWTTLRCALHINYKIKVAAETTSGLELRYRNNCWVHFQVVWPAGVILAVVCNIVAMQTVRYVRIGVPYTCSRFTRTAQNSSEPAIHESAVAAGRCYVRQVGAVGTGRADRPGQQRWCSVPQQVLAYYGSQSLIILLQCSRRWLDCCRLLRRRVRQIISQDHVNDRWTVWWAH